MFFEIKELELYNITDGAVKLESYWKSKKLNTVFNFNDFIIASFLLYLFGSVKVKLRF